MNQELNAYIMESIRGRFNKFGSLDDYGKREFKRRELEHELSHETQDAPRYKAPSEKYYHTVPFSKKDDAKLEKMRWDGDAKKWYHTSKSASDNSAFPKAE